MKTLTPVDAIIVPPARPDEVYVGKCFDRDATFRGLKALLAAADYSKAGDRHARLAAAGEAEREAARAILSDLTLQHLYDRPLTDDDGNIDSVMRVNYDIDHAAFASIAAHTVGHLKDHLLRSPGSEIQRVGRGLTGVMAAALAKLCDVHELIQIARKINKTTRARTVLGLPGTLSSRTQPNHPADDPRGISLLVLWGLSLGGGDALIGLNPAIDTVENISSILRLLDRLRRKTGAPTQICVLAHLKTQLACLEQGAPVEIIFQSLAGTEKTNLLEFDITVDLLDHAYRTMAERGPLSRSSLPPGEGPGVRVDSSPLPPGEGPGVRGAEQYMYFETGQGSEFTYGKHNGIDMTTTEALCYGLARRYDPFMVNNVTGFIGPETHYDSFEMILANLQDHFMGKLLGLPMGMAPCYTLHSNVTLEGQQIATELLTAAGANYYMDVGLNIDRMLAYFDTSAHDDQTLREIYNKRPAPEYLDWALTKGIFTRDEDGSVVRGPNWGNPRCLCDSDEELQELLAATPAIYGLDNAGSRPANAVQRQIKWNQAIGREAIHAELRIEELQRITPMRVIQTAAQSKESHLNSPDLGARLAPASAATLGPGPHRVQILISDGLSAEAVHHNAKDLLPVLLDGLRGVKISVGPPLIARYGRVKLAEEIADKLQAELVIYLIGERPGGDALASRSLSAYFTYRLGDPAVKKEAARFSKNPQIKFEYTVISNIYAGGLPPIEAGSVIVEKAAEILRNQAAGNRLEDLLNLPGDSSQKRLAENASAKRR